VSPTELVELMGNGQKLVALVRALGKPTPDVQLIDVSREALDRTKQMLRAEGSVRITAVQATYEDGVMQLPVAPDEGGAHPALGPISALDPPAASAFVHLVRRALGPETRC
jgi:uncharacterized SAM-dependent methyltransferase